MSRVIDFDIQFKKSSLNASQYEVTLQFEPEKGQKSLMRNCSAIIDSDCLLSLNQDINEYGMSLSKMVFHDEVIKEELLSARTSLGSDAFLHIRLQIGQSASELQNVYWETLRDPKTSNWLATSPNILLSRLLDYNQFDSVPTQCNSNPTALIFIANPTDLQSRGLKAIDVNGWVNKTSTAISRFCRNEDITVVASDMQHPGCTTSDQLINALRDKDIALILCHGQTADQHSYLFLENPDGTVDHCDAANLVDQICGIDAKRRPRLIVLLACQSAGMGTSTASMSKGVLAAIGPQLALRASIPAVIAMQDSLAIEAAGEFMNAFFAALSEHGRIDRAIATGRNAIKDPQQKWVPALLTYLKDCRIETTPITGCLPTQYRNELLSLLERLPIKLAEYEAIYWRSRPPLIIGESNSEKIEATQTLSNILDSLLELSLDPRKHLPIFTFVGRIIKRLDGKNELSNASLPLHQWLVAAKREVNLKLPEQFVDDLLEQLSQEEKATSLTVLVDPEDKDFIIKSWNELQTGSVTIKLYKQIDGEIKLTGQKSCHFVEVPEYFAQALIAQKDKLDAIEFLIPSAALNLKQIEQWKFGSKLSPLKDPIGGQYQIIVRPLERILIVNEEPQILEFWKKYWEALAQIRNDQLGNSIYWATESLKFQNDMANNSIENSKAIIGLLFTPIDSTAPLPESPLGIILGKGIPIALWRRSTELSDESEETFCQRIQMLLVSQPLSDLPYRLLQERQSTDRNRVIDHLTLIYDDPFKIPPIFQTLTDRNL